ncbi:MAG TPA: DUF255 domain-containing protein [Candidatus Acidoferrales bacterium]|nr:DUF255 domain-containing protein [Candidatus Acidoferrales bacterium]
MIDELHFSPRPNRANEIHWRQWDASTFAEAQAEDKPILLAISAVWCHWCHVMDETSYSDPDVIGTINARFIPVRVDNDRRPDVNARYNMGGWPTTAILTPAGDPITGGTYIPPAQLMRTLEQVSEFYKSHKDEIAQRVAQMEPKAQPSAGTAGDLHANMIARIVEEIADGFDPVNGGFGHEPKFPQTDALEFLLLEYRRSAALGAPDERLYTMLAKTALGMARGGMYDHVEGGFFRYSTTADWSVPHFEKMSEDHGGLLRFYSGLYRVSHNPVFRDTVRSASLYVRTTLRDPQTGRFYGSQDADEEYFSLPLDERKKRTAPYVDKTSYTNWSANLASAFFATADVLEDDDLGLVALRALDGIAATMMDEDGLAYHYIVPGGEPSVRGLLTDQVAYLRALIDAHEWSGEARFVERARLLADAIEKRFCDERGAYVDHAGSEEVLGRVRLQNAPLNENGHAADALLRLAVVAEEPRYAENARRVLSVFVKSYGKSGAFAAAYVAAVRRAIDMPTSVTVVGTPTQTDPFREAARSLPNPLVTVRTVEGPEAPLAYVCRGTSCLPPVRTPADLIAL